MAAQPIPRFRVCYPYGEFIFQSVENSQDLVYLSSKDPGIYEARYYKNGSKDAYYHLQHDFPSNKWTIQEGTFSGPDKFIPERSCNILDSLPPQITKSYTVLNKASLVGIALSILFGGFQLISKQKFLSGKVAKICNAIAVTAGVAAVSGQYIYRTQIKRIAKAVGLQIYNLIQQAETENKWQPILKND